MKDRIQKYMDYANINAGELANRLEVQRSNISHILNGRNKPSAAFIEKMLNVFPDLNARWLLTGDGSMINASVLTTAEQLSKTIKSKQESIVQAKNEIEDEQEIEAVRKPVIEKQHIEKTLKESPRIPNLWDDGIDRIVLFYKDGTFTSYINRSKK